MRLAVLSDIHGNLEAFNGCLNDLENFAVNRIVNLGDSIGYGPQPEEVLCLLKKRAFRISLATMNWRQSIRIFVSIFQRERISPWNGL